VLFASAMKGARVLEAACASPVRPCIFPNQLLLDVSINT
jgi:hypothetical protein